MLYKLKKKGIAIFLNDPHDVYTIETLKLKHIDEIQVVSQVDKNCGQLTLTKSVDKTRVKWDGEHEVAQVHFVEKDASVYNVVTHLLNVLMYREFEKKHIYMLHASAIMLENKCVLFFGGSGAGKTILMLDLMRAYPNAAYISNGSVLLEHEQGNIKVLGTYKLPIKLRGSTLFQYDYSFFREIFGDCNDNNRFAVKREYLPSDLRLPIYECGTNLQYDISLYFIKVNQANFIYYPDTTNYKYRMQLFQDLARHIKVSELFCTLNNAAVYFPSFDNKKLFSQRIAFINQLQTVMKGRLYGDLKTMTAFIIENESKGKKDGI